MKIEGLSRQLCTAWRAKRKTATTGRRQSAGTPAWRSLKWRVLMVAYRGAPSSRLQTQLGRQHLIEGEQPSVRSRLRLPHRGHLRQFTSETMVQNEGGYWGGTHPSRLPASVGPGLSPTTAARTGVKA